MVKNTVINIQIFSVRLFYFINCLFLIPNSSSAQFAFSKAIDIDGYSDGANSINLSDVGFLLTATSLCNNNQSECFTIMNTDGEGNVINRVQYQNYPWWITAGTPHGNVGVAIHEEAGLYFSGTIESGEDQFDVFLMKTDKQGDSLWMKIYGSNIWEVNNTIMFSSDTSLIMLNATSEIENKYLVWLIQIDLQGNILWEKILGENFKSASAQDIIRADNGDIVISYLTSEYNVPSTPYSMTVTRLNPQGNIKWTNSFASYDGFLGGTSTSLIQLDNNGFLVTYKRDAFPAPYPYPPIMVWLDSLGNVVQQYDFPANRELFITDLIKSSEGLIIGTGYGYFNLFGEGYGYGGWIFAFTQEGVLLWERYIADLNFPDKISWLSAIRETENKGFAIGGQIKTPTGYDIWLVKLDSMGCFEPECEGQFQVLTDGLEVIKPDPPAFKIYPNPSSQGFLNIETRYGTIDKSGFTIRVSDLTGKTVKQQPYKPVIDISGLVKGIYFLTVHRNEGEKIFTEKIVVQ